MSCETQVALGQHNEVSGKPVCSEADSIQKPSGTSIETALSGGPLQSESEDPLMFSSNKPEEIIQEFSNLSDNIDEALGSTKGIDPAMVEDVTASCTSASTREEETVVEEDDVLETKQPLLDNNDPSRVLDDAERTVDNTVDEEDAKRVQTFEVEQSQTAGGVEGPGTLSIGTNDDNFEEDPWHMGDDFNQIVSFDLEEFEDAKGDKNGTLEPSFMSPMAHEKASAGEGGRSTSPVSIEEGAIIPVVVGKDVESNKQGMQVDIVHEGRPETGYKIDNVASCVQEYCVAEPEQREMQRSLSSNFTPQEHSFTPVLSQPSQQTDQKESVDSPDALCYESSSDVLFETCLDNSERSTPCEQNSNSALTNTPVASNKKIVTADVVAKSPGRSIDSSIRRDKQVVEYWRDLDSKSGPMIPPIRKEFGSQSTSSKDRKVLRMAKETRYATVTNIPDEIVRLTSDSKQAVQNELEILKEKKKKEAATTTSDLDCRSSPSVILQLDNEPSTDDLSVTMLAKGTCDDACITLPIDKSGISKDSNLDLVGDVLSGNQSTVGSEPQSSEEVFQSVGLHGTKIFELPQEKLTDKNLEYTVNPCNSSWSRMKRLLAGTTLVAGGALGVMILNATMQRRSIGAPMR